MSLKGDVDTSAKDCALLAFLPPRKGRFQAYSRIIVAIKQQNPR